MKLFERIRYISTTQGIPLYRIAEYLGESPSKFNQWLNEKSQKNIWEHLPKIIELFPNIRREWLYMGDEPMLKDGSTSSEPSHIAAAPEQRLATEDQMIQLERENAQLRELLEAKNELLASKDKIIALHEENKRLAESMSVWCWRHRLASSRLFRTGGTCGFSGSMPASRLSFQLRRMCGGMSFSLMGLLAMNCFHASWTADW